MTTATNTNGITSTTTGRPEVTSPILHAHKCELYRRLRDLEARSKPKFLAESIRTAIDSYTQQVATELANASDELEASRHHAAGLKRHNDELLDNQNVLRNAFDNQQTLTKNALVEGRGLADKYYEAQHQLKEALQQAGDAPAAQDIIDRLRKRIALLDDIVSSYEMTIATQADQLLAKEQSLQEVYVDVRNAENNSDRLSVELDGVRAQLKETHHQVEREQQAVQRLLEKNRILRQATTAAGAHLRQHDRAVSILFEAVGQAQALLRDGLSGRAGDGQTLSKMLGIVHSVLVIDAMEELSPKAEAEGA